jgi:hypothetical protein
MSVTTPSGRDALVSSRRSLQLKVLTMVYTTQNYKLSGLCPSSAILNTSVL